MLRDLETNLCQEWRKKLGRYNLRIKKLGGVDGGEGKWESNIKRQPLNIYGLPEEGLDWFGVFQRVGPGTWQICIRMET